MAKGKGAASLKITDQIETLKYVMLFFNAFVVMLSIAVFALSMWLCFEPGLGEWIRDLELQEFYVGSYVLIFASLIMIVCAAIGCFSVVSESPVLLVVFIGSQALCFLLGLAGAASLLAYSTQYSGIQEMIKESMRRLIINAHHERSRQILSIIQENIGCCGAEGPTDYTRLHQPLPSQCRDTVTGNPFFHGCVDELTWYFEEKTGWIAALAMTLSMMNIFNIAMTTILTKAVKKEDNAYSQYRK